MSCLPEIEKRTRVWCRKAAITGNITNVTAEADNKSCKKSTNSKAILKAVETVDHNKTAETA